MTSALAVDDLVVSYDRKRHVLDHVSLAVRPGETFGLIGLNGEGKTTLIKTVLGLRNQNSGSITLMGRDNHHDRARDDLAYLPERFDPPWFLSGIDFVKFSGQLYRRSINEAEVNEWARCLGLDTAALPRSVNTYSKGMRQKLGLIATVATGCQLLILDEPMSGLDPRARVQVKDLIGGAKGQGKTVFLSSHILSDMDEICDRVAVLHGGTIRYIGPPANMREQTGMPTLEKAFLSIIGAGPGV
jgi:ABC-2 type transport system ATP-binding protein